MDLRPGDEWIIPVFVFGAVAIGGVVSYIGILIKSKVRQWIGKSGGKTDL